MASGDLGRPVLWKWFISFQAALLFALVASPVAYRVTSRLHETAPDTLQHLLLHTVIYLCIVRLMMGVSEDGDSRSVDTTVAARGGDAAVDDQ